MKAKRIVSSFQMHEIDDKDLIDYLESLPRLKRSEFIRASIRKALPATPKFGVVKPTNNQPVITTALPKTIVTNADLGLVYVDDDQM